MATRADGHLPGPPRVTLRDVALRAGVSPRTVSNVVNDFPYVAEPTRVRVREATPLGGDWDLRLGDSAT